MPPSTSNSIKREDILTHEDWERLRNEMNNMFDVVNVPNWVVCRVQSGINREIGHRIMCEKLGWPSRRAPSLQTMCTTGYHISNVGKKTSEALRKAYYEYLETTVSVVEWHSGKKIRARVALKPGMTISVVRKVEYMTCCEVKVSEGENEHDVVERAWQQRITDDDSMVYLGDCNPLGWELELR